jgi:hypothetical protein
MFATVNVPTPDSARARTAPWLGARYVLASAMAATLVALALGVPTDVIPNPWFTRMIPAETLNYLFWITTSLLTGALLGTYSLPRIGPKAVTAPVAGSSFLGLLAVGCPVCNKLVVALLGVSGALSYFAPIQPLLGGLALVLAAGALVLRLRAYGRSCRLSASPDAEAPAR